MDRPASDRRGDEAGSGLAAYGARLEAGVARTSISVVSGDSAKASIAGFDRLSSLSISAVGQFPTRNQITLGGLP